jgi:hypothetical protein
MALEIRAEDIKEDKNKKLRFKKYETSNYNQTIYEARDMDNFRKVMTWVG